MCATCAKDKERRDAAQKKYRAKKKYCEACDTTLSIKHFTWHLQSKKHKCHFVLYKNLPNKWLELKELKEL